MTSKVERSDAKDLQVLVGMVTISAHRQWNSGETLVDIGWVLRAGPMGILTQKFLGINQ